MKGFLVPPRIALAFGLLVISLPLIAQTTAGIGTTIVFPLTAQTTSFASKVTLFNPGGSAMTASVSFHEATNSSTPGRTTTCSDVPIGAGRSVEIVLTTQCDMTAASHFGLLIVADKASPQSHNFYGYMRVQNPQGIGFSVEGFPVENFNNQVSEATGLIRQAAAPGYQTNCFVGSLDQPVNYTVKLFNGASGAQIGSTLTGSLAAYKQFRYLDVFGSNGVNAPAGDQFNVRAEFTQTSGGTANLIGFCTVQDNTSFGADFRVAKSYGSPSGNFFAQGGNAFGTPAVLGTTDNQPLDIIVNGGLRAMRYEVVTSPGLYPGAVNVIGGASANDVSADVAGATIAGGGMTGIRCGPLGTSSCANSVSEEFGTVGGGLGNSADDVATVAGGIVNSASAYAATVGGGQYNSAAGYAATVPGGYGNNAAGSYSVAMGYQALTMNDATGSFVFSDSSLDPGTSTGIFASGHPNEFIVGASGGVYLYTQKDYVTGCVIAKGSGTWACSSSRELKRDFEPVDSQAVLDKVIALPINTWRYKTEPNARHLGPTAEDFRDAFALGPDSKSIAFVDEDGVALAAIQGLHQMLLEKDAKIQTQEARLSALEQRLKQMEDAIAELHLSGNQIDAHGRGSLASFAGR